MDQTILFYVLAALSSFLVGASKGGLPMVGVLSVPILALAISPVAAAALLLPMFTARANIKPATLAIT